MTELMVMQEEIKTYPFGDVWNEYCERCGVLTDGKWFEEIVKYEQDVLNVNSAEPTVYDSTPIPNTLDSTQGFTIFLS